MAAEKLPRIEDEGRKTPPHGVRYSAFLMRSVKNALVAILRLLGAATVLALILLVIELVASVLLAGFDWIFH